MLQAIKERVIVQTGGRIELDHPELCAGSEAEVIIMVEEAAERPSLASFAGQGKGCFEDAAEIDAFLRAERDSWES